jgi:hypothetical protein
LKFPLNDSTGQQRLQQQQPPLNVCDLDLSQRPLLVSFSVFQLSDYDENAVDESVLLSYTQQQHIGKTTTTTVTKNLNLLHFDYAEFGSSVLGPLLLANRMRRLQWFQVCILLAFARANRTHPLVTCILPFLKRGGLLRRFLETERIPGLIGDAYSQP